MLVLLLGLTLFLGVHGLPIFQAQRMRLIGLTGAGPYRLLVSLLSLLGLYLIVQGFGDYRANAWAQIWQPPRALRHFALTLMLPVFILLLSTYLPGKIKALAKHPTLLAVKIWATAHLLANGDLGGMLLFASFLTWAVLARISLKRRAVVIIEPQPFGRNDWIATVAGLAIYVAFLLVLHPFLFGVRVLP